jgi:hypothetical protein
MVVLTSFSIKCDLEFLFHFCQSVADLQMKFSRGLKCEAVLEFIFARVQTPLQQLRFMGMNENVLLATFTSPAANISWGCDCVSWLHWPIF